MSSFSRKGLPVWLGGFPLTLGRWLSRRRAGCVAETRHGLETVGSSCPGQGQYARGHEGVKLKARLARNSCFTQADVLKNRFGIGPLKNLL